MAKAPTEPLPPTLSISYKISVMDDAKVFYKYQQKLPSVVNYFTKYSEQEIIDFYKDIYGEPNHSESKRGRVVYHFSLGSNGVRVIVSNQDKKRQVDVLMK